MSSAITQGFYDALSGDAALTALLASYGGAPAVFTTDPVPEDAQFPYVVTAGEVAQVPHDAKVAGTEDAAVSAALGIPATTARGREIVRDIRCYDGRNDVDAPTGSAERVDDIKEAVRAIFHRMETSLTITGFNVVVAEVSGVTNTDEEDVYGRIVTVRLTLEES